MNGMETVYTICVLIAMIVAVAGLSKLKRFLKRYSSTCRTEGSAR